MQLTQQKKQVVVPPPPLSSSSYNLLLEMTSNLDNIFYALLPRLIKDKASLSHN